VIFISAQCQEYGLQILKDEMLGLEAMKCEIEKFANSHHDDDLAAVMLSIYFL
jgi:hypothetical protein